MNHFVDHFKIVVSAKASNLAVATPGQHLKRGTSRTHFASAMGKAIWKAEIIQKPFQMKWQVSEYYHRNKGHQDSEQMKNQITIKTIESNKKH